MSPRPGGETDKFGNRYEGAWTVQHLLFVLLGRAESITVEDFGDLEQGAEFTYRHGDIIEVHQLKRQNKNLNSWTVKSLLQKEIWPDVKHHVSAGRQFHFVSTIPSRPLQELTERVRRSENPEEFIEKWLTVGLRDSFDELASSGIYGSVASAWEILRGFWIEWPDERHIVNTNSTLCDLLLDGADGKLAAVGLGDLIMNNLGVKLNSAKVEEQLRDYGLRRKKANTSGIAAEQVEATTVGWAANIAQELLKPSIPRSEAKSICDAITDSNRLLLVSGSAGSGKSAVMHEAVEELRSEGVVVLGLRLDRLEPFSSTVELGNRIGLDSSPVTALGAVAADGPCVLFVDQLDAVSLVSGRMPNNFDTVANLVLEATAFPNMRIVFACRDFDIKNDHRIRDLMNGERCAQVNVGELTDAQIDVAVAQLGLDPSQLNDQQRVLLQLPLHLVLLRGIATEADALSFQTTKQLFDAFWRRKLLDCTGRRSDIRFNRVIEVVSHAISKRQRLSVPVEVLDADDLSIDAGILISEHVLVEDGRQIAFFHESFFDYSFARGWVLLDQTLVEFLLDGEQELFRRAQVRQIVTYLREHDPDRFVTEVGSLLSEPDVRYHIKDVVLAVLRELHEPSLKEWEMVSTVLDQQPAFEARLWSALCSSEWFSRLDAEGAIEEWLSGPDESRQNHAIDMMVAASKTSPNRLAEIVASYRGASAYPGWLSWIARFVDLHQSHALFNLVREAVGEGGYEGYEHELWQSVYDLGRRQPVWALELIAAHLIERPNALTRNEDGKIITLLENDQTVIEIIKDAAAGAPELFCNKFIPYMQSVMSLTAITEPSQLPVRDRHFWFREPESIGRGLDDVLLLSAKESICALVALDLKAARPVLRQLADDPHETSQWLLYQAFSAAGRELAQWAAETLLQGDHRFMSGYSSNGVWAAREVILATSSFISDESFSRLESSILSLRFPWEGRRPGWYMFNLLSAMEWKRLSEVGRRRLGELRRLTGRDQPSVPSSSKVGVIGSPIRADSADRMSDAQWLKAMAKHDHNVTNWESMTGGAPELAVILKGQVKGDPLRFCKLALLLTEHTHPAYSNAILMGLGEAECLADPVPVFDAVRRIAALAQGDNDRWIGRALRKYLESTPLDLVELILDRTLNAIDPSSNELAYERVDKSNIDAENVYMSGINGARGSALEVLGDLLVYDADGTRTDLVRSNLNRIAGDPAIAVRSCAAHLLHAAMRYARPQAIEAFKKLVETDDIILATRHVVSLIVFLGYSEPSLVQALINRMIRSDSFEVREVGGQLAAFAALQWDANIMLTSALESGDTAHRIGVAKACAHCLSNTSDMELAGKTLVALMNDPEEEVREAAAKVAGALRGERLRPYERILEALIKSKAFTHALPQLLFTLEYASDRIDDLALSCARRFIEVFGVEASDIRFGAAGDAHHVSELLMRAYMQASTKSRRSDILDVLDDLLLVGAYGVADVIEESER